ncbi:MAG: MCE family protein [Fibrobacteres bacterium]|nr:MCE family protein [Fibrobacterota bacterium]
MSNRLLGYITVVCIASFVVLVVYSQIADWQKYRTIQAYADDIGNLKLQNPLSVNGMQVGYVTSIGRQDGKARLTLKILKSIVIKKDYLVLNKDVSLTGDRALTLYPGITAEPLHPDSQVYLTFVPGIAEGISQAMSLKDLVIELRAVVKEYSKIDPKNDTLFTTQVKEALRFIENASLKVDLLVKENESKVQQLVNATSQFTAGIKQTSTRLKPEAEKAVALADTLSKKADILVNELSPALASLDSLLASMEKPDNSFVGALANKDGYDNIKKSITKIRSLIQILGEEGVGLDIDFF